MKKKILRIAVAIIMLFAVAGLVGCNGYSRHSNSDERIELQLENQLRRDFSEANMTEIWTAQDLANRNNDLDGSFVLRSNIHLAEWGNWTPIGARSRSYEPCKAFRGALINPNGFEIENLYINRVLQNEGDFRLIDAGLFGRLRNAFIDGVILSEVYISVLDENGGDWERSFVGGIVAVAWLSTIMNSSVSGNLISNYSVGGIAGMSDSSQIINCNFEGNIEVIWHTRASYAGRIVGWMAGLYSPPWSWQCGLVKNCTVVANINGHYTASVGGIVGVSHSLWGRENTFDIIHSTFDGYLTGYLTGILRGWAPFLPNNETA